MSPVWQFRVELAGLLAAGAGAVARGVRPGGGWGVLVQRGEDAGLLSLTAAVAGRVVWRQMSGGGLEIAGVGKGWVGMFGAGCAVFLAVKAIRVTRANS